MKADKIAFAPGASKLAMVRAGAIEIRSARTLEQLQRFSGHKEEITNIAWSRDGSRIGSTASNGCLLVHDLATRETVLEVKKEEALHALDFHPSGKSIAYGGQDNIVYQATFPEGKEEIIKDGQPYWITTLGYSPDGSRLAVGDECCDIWLFEVASGKQLFHGKHHVECWLNQVAWHPNGTTFLFACRPNSHGGEPTVYQLNNLTEAAREEKVSASRSELLAAVDQELALDPNQDQRTALVGLRRALEKEEQGQFPVAAITEFEQLEFGSYGLPMIPGTSINNVATQQGLVGIGSPPETPTIIEAVPEELSPTVQGLLKAHRKTYKQQVEQLNKAFCINQWQVKE